MGTEHFWKRLDQDEFDYFRNNIARINGQEQPYYCCSNDRDTYQKQEEEGWLKYLGTGEITYIHPDYDEC